MRFFTDIMHDPNVDQAEIVACFDAYAAHLKSIRDRLPGRVYEFATADWHYDDGTKGLHDSWVESLKIEETSAGDRQRERSIEIVLRLLSAYRNRHIEVRYHDVRKYRLITPARFRYPPSFKTGHGDWLYDEIDLSRGGFVIHRVRFSRGSTWHIECRDFEVEHIAIGTPTSATEL